MTRDLANDLVRRMVRPQQIGLFGHRGVGKTTLVSSIVGFSGPVGSTVPSSTTTSSLRDSEARSPQGWQASTR